MKRYSNAHIRDDERALKLRAKWEPYAKCDACGAQPGMPCKGADPFSSRPNIVQKPHINRALREPQS